MKALRATKVIAVVLLLISLFCTVDLGLNLLYNTEPSIHDGSYGTYSILHSVFGIFGDSLWSFDMFFLAFKNSALITYVLFVTNVVLYLITTKERIFIMQYTYRTRGTCSSQITFEVENGIVHNVVFTGGCNGNLKAIAKLVEGMEAERVIELLRGNTCGMKNTSCADQLANALKEAASAS